MWENTIELLKKKGVIVDKGLSDAEIGQIEQLYKIRVPQILQDLWKEGLPISKSFYNWRDFTPRNIGKIKSAMDKPFNDISELAGEANWNGDWGEMPASSGDIARFYQEKGRRRPQAHPHIWAQVYAGGSGRKSAGVLHMRLGCDNLRKRSGNLFSGRIWREKRGSDGFEAAPPYSILERPAVAGTLAEKAPLGPNRGIVLPGTTTRHRAGLPRRKRRPDWILPD